MPRKGMGQKVSSVPGQTYGARTEQEASQAVQPMAEMAPPPTPRPQPGNLGVSLTGATTRPTELISAPMAEPSPLRLPDADLARYGHMAITFETLAGMPNASRLTRILARRLRSMLPVEEM